MTAQTGFNKRVCPRIEIALLPFLILCKIIAHEGLGTGKFL
jgi:hypothetical protein